MTLFSDALSLLAASQVILFLVMLVISANPVRIRLSGALMMMGILLFLAIPLIDWHMQVETSHWVWIFPAITPSALLLFVWFVFEEQECKIPLWLIVVAAFSIAISVYYAAIGVGLPGAPLWAQLFKLLVVGVALYIVNKGSDADLVEERFRARRLFIGALAFVILVTMGIEISADFNTAGLVAVLQKVVVFLFTLSFNVYFLRLNPRVQLIGDPVLVKDDTDDPLIAQLLEKMQNERLYADHDLRVGGLADLMQIPEYQLRKKINQQLGYRNFNQFVNRYRIEEAGKQLTESQRTPVLTVALDVGFRSISSFNSAFQAQFGVSPTRYRSDWLEKERAQGFDVESESSDLLAAKNA